MGVLWLHQENVWAIQITDGQRAIPHLHRPRSFFLTWNNLLWSLFRTRPPLWWQLHLCLITSLECWLFLQGHWVNAASTTPATPATCCWTELLKRSVGALLTFFFMPEGERFSGERLNAAADVSKARLPHRRDIIKLYGRMAPTQLWNTSKLHIGGMRRIGRLIYGSVDSWTRCFLTTASLMAPEKRKNLPLQRVHAWVHNPSPEVFRTGSSARRAVTGGVTMWLWINVEGERWKLENVHESMTMWGKLQEPRRMCVTAEGKMKAACISPILVNFEGNSSVRCWTAHSASHFHSWETWVFPLLEK